MVFSMINNDKQLDHFCAILERCPEATDVEESELNLTPLLVILHKERRGRNDANWIRCILNANSDSAKRKDFNGKTPLQLAYEHGAATRIIDMILHAYPEAQNERETR